MTHGKALSVFSAFCLFLFLVALAGFRLLGPDADFHHYENLFYYGESPQGETKELSFILLRYLVNDTLGLAFSWFVFLYALLGVSVKFYLMARLSSLFWVSLFVYLMVYFPLHEYTQIRAGIASGIMLLSLKDVTNGRFLRFLGKVTLAVFFHWSALAALPLYLLRGKSINFLIFLLFALLLFIPLGSVLLNLVEALFNFYDPIARYYLAHSGHVEKFPIINFVFLLNMALLWIGLWFVFVGKLSARIDNLPTLYVAVHAVSMISYVFFAVMERPVLSFRLSEFYSTVMILSIPVFLCVSGKNLFFRMSLFLIPIFYFLHLFFRVNIFPEILEGL